MKSPATILSWMFVLVAAWVALACPASHAATTNPAIDRIIAQVKVPPDWLATVPVQWDVNRPWKEGRLEIRRLLALDEAANRQAVK